ncbi:MAG: hypothetical protein V2A79_18200 [Planctomycetota bacterium]
MILRGGIFNHGFGGLGAIGMESMLIMLDPKAGAGSPFTTLLQNVMQQRGASKLVADGKWGQCTHSAFTKSIGAPPSYDVLDELFGLSKFGVPAQNVSVWKPGPLDVCWSGQDDYEVPPLEQQAAIPDAGFLLAEKFNMPLPPGFCTQGRIPDMTAKKCLCPKGMYENVTTGACEAFEQPGKLPPYTTQTLLAPATKWVPPKMGTTGTTPVVVPVTLKIVKGGGASVTSYPCPTDHPYYSLAHPTSVSCGPSLNAYPVTIGGKVTGAWKCVNGSVAVPGINTAGKQGMICPTPAVAPSGRTGVSRGITLLGPSAVVPAQPAAGMSAGAKVMLALVVIGVVGGGGWLLLRKKAGTEAVANRRRRRHRRHWRNCGYRSNCGE